MFSEIYNIVEAIKNTSSTLEKVEILERNKDNLALRQYFEYCLDFKKFGIKKIPSIVTTSSIYSWNEVIDFLNTLSQRKLTGNAAIEKFQDILSSLNEQGRVVLQNIIQKNPRCGVSINLANRVWENLIDFQNIEVKLEKAMPFSNENLESVKFPCLAQKKCDGARTLIFKIDEEVIILSSGGKKLHKLTNIESEVKSLNIQGNFVLDGEFLVFEDGKPLSRKIGNGIANKSGWNTISEEEASKVRICVWDIIPFDEYLSGKASKSYYESFEFLLEQIKSCKYIYPVEYKTVSDKQEAMEYFREMISRGEEGIILKSNNGFKWTGKRAKENVKIKLEIENTFEIIEVFEGQEKYSNQAGGFTCKSSDGKVVVNVGSGLSDEDRVQAWEHREELKGKMVEVRSNGIIKASDGTYSMFLPRFIEYRYEKNVADDYETIVALSNGSKLLK